METDKSEIKEENISANVVEDGVRKIAEEEYGLIATKIKRVDGYDDLNFYLSPPVCINFLYFNMRTKLKKGFFRFIFCFVFLVNHKQQFSRISVMAPWIYAENCEFQGFEKRKIFYRIHQGAASFKYEIENI